MEMYGQDVWNRTKSNGTFGRNTQKLFVFVSRSQNDSGIYDPSKFDTFCFVCFCLMNDDGAKMANDTMYCGDVIFFFFAQSQQKI